MALDPPRIQDSGRGPLAFEIRANLYLTNRETGERANLAMPVRFDLAGSWVLDSARGAGARRHLVSHWERGETEEEGEKFTFDDGCIPPEFAEQYPDYEIVDGECSLCPGEEEGGSPGLPETGLAGPSGPP